MDDPPKAWDAGQVRTWLDRRVDAARLAQAAADRRGYAARDEYDEAAAEEWVCGELRSAGRIDDRAAFAAYIKGLLGQEKYRVAGIHDDHRFDRHVRATLRKIARMTRTNDGFALIRRYQ